MELNWLYFVMLQPFKNRAIFETYIFQHDQVTYARSVKQEKHINKNMFQIINISFLCTIFPKIAEFITTRHHNFVVHKSTIEMFYFLTKTNKKLTGGPVKSLKYIYFLAELLEEGLISLRLSFLVYHQKRCWPFLDPAEGCSFLTGQASFDFNNLVGQIHK